MRRFIAIASCALALLIPRTGCHSGPQDVSNKSRAEQEQAFRGDPEKAKQVGEQMKQKYMGNPEQSMPKQAAPR